MGEYCARVPRSQARTSWCAHRRSSGPLTSARCVPPRPVSADEWRDGPRCRPVPRHMLDIGGAARTLFPQAVPPPSAARIHDSELPEGSRRQRHLLAAERMGDRVRHRAGDVLRDDLGEATYDLVLISSLLHHFDEPANRALMCRIARALRPAAPFWCRSSRAGLRVAMAGSSAPLLDLYFHLAAAAAPGRRPEIGRLAAGGGLHPRRAVS